MAPKNVPTIAPIPPANRPTNPPTNAPPATFTSEVSAKTNGACQIKYFG